MPIDMQTALSSDPSVRDIQWTPTDVIYYHLSLGARADELSLVYEKQLKVLSSFALVAGTGPSVGITRPPAMSLPGIDIDLRRILHAGQALEVHRPIPVRGRAQSSQRVARLIDKGKAAVIELETTAQDDDGPLWTHVSRIWAHGEGGFGSTGASEAAAPEQLDQLCTIDTTIDPNQAALYRLNGDYNPLHIDPHFAQAAGFEAPILHGLATFGVVALELVRQLGEGDPERLQRIEAGFSSPVTPGDCLRTTVFNTDSAAVAFTTENTATASVALKRGSAVLSS